jgi:hypothetical protein
LIDHAGRADFVRPAPPALELFRMKSPLLFLAASLLCALARAAAPDLDLDIRYYSRVLTPEGVTRESRYAETMSRRPGHVWSARVIPNQVAGRDEAGHKSEQHKHFNHAVLARHVTREGNKLRLEYVDAHEKQVIAIPPSEYENVDFDGSWNNSFYLLDPKLVEAMPLSPQASATAGARWRQAERNGVFQRVLWDERRQIPLVIESGDKAGTFYRRVDVKPMAPRAPAAAPWSKLAAYGQKEYADFLD